MTRGIRHETCTPHTPSQNGVAERGWRTIFNKARAMMLHAGLSSGHWTYAVHTACYLTNRTSTKALDGDTPFRALTNKKPNVKNLRVFGCPVYVHVEDHTKKFQPRAQKGVFLGYTDNSPGYRVTVSYTHLRAHEDLSTSRMPSSA